MKPSRPTEKKPQQILFCKNKYTAPVKIEHWEYRVLAEKKDNDVYRDGLSNMYSTYHRLGGDNEPRFRTETRNMTEQIFTKSTPIFSFKPLVNFTSYPCTDTPGRNKLMKSADLAQLPQDFGIMDYVTTQQDYYRVPYPGVTKPLMMASSPWLLNRVIRSDLTQNYGTAPPAGDYQCIDTHTPIGHIRQMRLSRNQSFDPATCLQNFPKLTKPLDTEQNKIAES